MYIVQSLLNGLFIGSLYGLIAMGLTMVFGVMKIINFAHGSMIMIGMFITYGFTVFTGFNLYLSLFLVCPLLFGFGYAIQKFLIKSVLVADADAREPIGVLLLTTGLWFFLDNIFMVFFGPDYRTLEAPFSRINWFVFDAILINKVRSTAFAITCLVTVVIYFFLNRTETGRSIKAVGQDRRMAGLLGIDTYKIFNIAFGIGACTAGVAGTMLSTFYYVQPNVGSLFGVKAFIIVVLGGLGSIAGALLGGIIVGIIESVGAQFVSSTMTEGIVYFIFLLVLFFKPSGLFGLKSDW